LVEALSSGLGDAAVAVAADTPARRANLALLAALGLAGPDETVASGAAALVLTRPGELGPSGPRLRALQLTRAAPDEPPSDPLADRLGRTVAAAHHDAGRLGRPLSGFGAKDGAGRLRGRRLIFEAVGP
jgi:hypothetical protein